MNFPGVVVFSKHRAALGRRGDQTLIKFIEFGQCLLGIGEFLQARRHRSFLYLVGIVIAVTRGSEVGKVKRPHVAIEEFGAHRNQTINYLINAPEIVQLTGFKTGFETNYSATPLLIFQESQIFQGEVRFGRLGVEWAVRKPDHECAHPEIRVMQVQIIATPHHLLSISAKVATYIRFRMTRK